MAVRIRTAIWRFVESVAADFQALLRDRKKALAWDKLI
jgi:hypothetical protein